MIKSEGTNHQRFFRQNDNYSKTEKENKNRRHSFREKLSDKELAKFQLNRLRVCRLGVKNVRLTLQNFRSEKTRKIYFLRHLNHIRIITPNQPCWCLPERDHLAITIGVWQVICSRPTKDFWGCRVTATDSSKSKNRCTIYREGPAFFRCQKWKISFVRRTSFVLALKHPSRTKSAFTSYILHKLNASLTKATGHRFFHLLLQSFAGYDSVAMDVLQCFSVKRPKRTRPLLFFSQAFE